MSQALNQYLITFFLTNARNNITRTSSQWVTAGSAHEALDICASIHPGCSDFRCVKRNKPSVYVQEHTAWGL